MYLSLSPSLSMPLSIYLSSANFLHINSFFSIPLLLLSLQNLLSALFFLHHSLLQRHFLGNSFLPRHSFPTIPRSLTLLFAQLPCLCSIPPSILQTSLHPSLCTTPLSMLHPSINTPYLTSSLPNTSHSPHTVVRSMALAANR